MSHIKYGKTGLEPVTIICKKHGPFEIKPTVTNRKTLCPTCSKDADKQRRFEHFISKARKIHGNKYDYSKVKFINGYTPVEIICHTHGIFTQRPNDHLSGKGCSKCYHESKKLKTDQFIKKAQKIWGERWDYSKTSCESRCNSLLTITCRKHGDFVQSANTHLAGNVGCIKCQRESGYFRSPRTKEDFIEAARKIHGNKFDYSLVDDTCGLNTTVKIICKKHGIFEQKVHNHLQGHGCRKCRNAQQEKIISIMLIKNNIAYEKEKMFKWLKRKGYLKLDFYLPEYNVAIEAQGAMHFGIHKNNKYKMEEEDYEDLFERDRLKYDLCKKHGIHILYFCYCKEWVPEDYIDKVYTTVSELMAAIKEHSHSIIAV